MAQSKHSSSKREELRHETITTKLNQSPAGQTPNPVTPWQVYQAPDDSNLGSKGLGQPHLLSATAPNTHKFFPGLVLSHAHGSPQHTQSKNPNTLFFALTPCWGSNLSLSQQKNCHHREVNKSSVMTLQFYQFILPMCSSIMQLCPDKSVENRKCLKSRMHLTLPLATHEGLATYCIMGSVANPGDHSPEE